MSNMCPSCGSSNINFRREKVNSKSNSSGGVVKISKRVSAGGKKSNTTYNYHTIGFCKDCGNTWEVDDKNNGKHTALWWILAICLFPITISVWFWKSEKINLSKTIKGIIIGVFWIFLLIFSGSGDITEEVENSIEQTEVIQTVVTEENTEETESSMEQAEVIQTSITEEIKEEYKAKDETEIIATPQSIENNQDIPSDTNNGTVFDNNTNSEQNVESNDSNNLANYENAPVQGNSIIVNATNGKVHKSSCSKLPEEDNRIYFSSLEETQNNGYTDLCGICFK